MSRRITAGNDAPFRWAVKLQGQPFNLSGKDVKVYVINSRGEIPVARLTIEGHEVSGVFEGRYQTRLGEHSLALRVNEGRPEMKTATVANVFELVQWSADAGGSDEGDVIVAPVLIESELSIGGGSSYDDTEVKNELARLEREKADKSELTELSAEVSGLSERIDELGEGGSEVFVAEYGKTKYAEIIAARNAGKAVICNNGPISYRLSFVVENGLAYFTATYETFIYTAVCNPNGDLWGSKTTNIAHELTTLANGNAEITIAGKTAEVATPQYVENAIQQSGGQGGGEPSQYIKDATTSADGNTLILTKKDNTQVAFSPSGGGSTPSGGNDEMQRILAGNTPNLIWEDLDGKLHYEHGELASRKAQNDPTFKTTCRRLLSCSPSNTEELTFLFGVQNDKGTIEEVYPYLFAPVKLAIINFAFSGAPNIKDWSFLKLFNTSNVTSMVGVFYGASADYIDVSNWDTSNVTKMGRDGNPYPLFGDFRSIIGLNKWNVSKVENMDKMFGAKIEDIGDVSTWDVSSCSSFKDLFRENSVIKNIDLSSWAIKSGASISNMFFNMGKVETIGFPNIANGCTAGGIGRYLDSLTSIFFKEGSTFGCSLSFNESPLTAESVKQLLAHASSTPDEGATLTFRGSLYASFSAEDKVEIDALRNVAVANGWTIVNMG